MGWGEGWLSGGGKVGAWVPCPLDSYWNRMKERGSREATQPRQVEGLLDKMSAIEGVSIYNGEVEGAVQGAGRRGEERGGWKLSVEGAE